MRKSGVKVVIFVPGKIRKSPGLVQKRLDFFQKTLDPFRTKSNFFQTRLDVVPAPSSISSNVFVKIFRIFYALQDRSRRVCFFRNQKSEESGRIRRNAKFPEKRRQNALPNKGICVFLQLKYFY